MCLYLQDQGCKYPESWERHDSRGEQQKLGFIIHSEQAVFLTQVEVVGAGNVDPYRLCCSRGM